jgi:hypothetical protein
VLQVVFIDAGAGALDAQHASDPELSDALSAIAQLVTSKGKPLHVEMLGRDADLADPRIYQPALRKVSSRARLQDGLLVSGDAERARVAHSVSGLAVLRFKPSSSSGTTAAPNEFDDWAQLPLLVASRMRGESQVNLEVALQAYLQARHDLELASIEPGATAQHLRFRANAWRPIEGDNLGEASGVLAPLPVEGDVTRDSDGRVASLSVSEPSDEALSEARNFVASLVHHGQLETHAKGQRARGTHQIVVDAKGKRRLVRSRVSYR